jgi:DNA-directed RNA polymerase subunit RPC12/RpoP
MEAYCFKCKAKREIKSPQQVTLKNGRPATRGACPECGTKVFRIGSGGG